MANAANRLNPTTQTEFANRVNRYIEDQTGGMGIWDLVGDWPEADFYAQNDTFGAVAWILRESGWRD